MIGRPTKFIKTLEARLSSILYPEKEIILASSEEHIIFKNGSIIKTIKTNGKPIRGHRASMMAYWSDKLGCFVDYDGNKPEGERYRYFILDDNDEKVYVDIAKEENNETSFIRN